LLAEADQTWNRQLVGVLLEEQLSGDTFRRPDQRNRPVPQMGRDPWENLRVILRELHFRRAAAGIDDALGMGDADLAVAGCLFGNLGFSGSRLPGWGRVFFHAAGF